MPRVDDYLLGTDTLESTRLGIQHRLWAAHAHALWERAGIGPGSRVVDVGSGPGHAAADLAQLVGPGGRVLALEGSPAYAEEFAERMRRLGLGHAEVRLGDVHGAASLAGSEAGTFDAAYCRWVLSFSNDVGGLLGQLRACLKPGGRVVIQDYFNWRAMSVAPRREEFSRAIRGILDYWEGNEGSNDVMAHVPRLLREQGFTLTHLEANQRVARPGSPLWAWPDSFWPSIIPRVVSAGFLSRADSEAFFAMWAEVSSDPDVFMVVPPVFDAIAVRE